MWGLFVAGICIGGVTPLCCGDLDALAGVVMWGTDACCWWYLGGLVGGSTGGSLVGCV